MIERIEINLLPAEYRIRKRTLNIPRSIIWSVVVFAVLANSALFYTIYLRGQETELTEAIDALEKEISANAHIQAEIAKLRKEKDITDEKIKALQRINVNREKWVRLMETLSGKLPAYTWLISVKEELGARASADPAAAGGAAPAQDAAASARPDKLIIEARTYSFPEVAHYMSRLEESEYITSVELAGVEQISGESRMLYRFSLSCVVNKDVGVGTVATSEGGDE